MRYPSPRDSKNAPLIRGWRGVLICSHYLFFGGIVASSRRRSRKRRARIIAGSTAAGLAVIAATIVGTTVPAREAPAPSVSDIQARADAFSEKVANEMNATAKAAYEARTVAVPFQKDRPLRYLLVGDSLSNGSAATVPAKAFREVVKSKLGERGPVESVLAGRAGEGVKLIAPQAVEAGGGFDVVVVEVGTNDAGQTPVAEFADRYEGMIRTLRAQSPKAALVCLGAWRDEKMGAADNAVIDKTCKAFGGRYRPLSQHYTISTNRWTTGVMSNGKPAEDNFHPSDAGHEKIAGEILNALRLDGEKP